MDVSFKINIEQDAKQWLEKKGKNVLTISRMDITGCCVAHEDIDVNYRAPKSGNYEKIDYDGLEIYVEKNLKFKDDLVDISLTGFGPFKHIFVDGLRRFSS